MASYTASSLTFGSHSISAVYSGDSSYQPATGGALTETVSDFAMTVLNGSETVYPGGQTSYSLAISPLGSAALAGTVSLSVSGIPPAGKAFFSPATVAQGAGSTNVTLQVDALSASVAPPQGGLFGRRSLPLALGFLLLPFAGRLRKMRLHLLRLVVFVLAGAALAAGLAGCGTISLTPQSFSITVTATSGPLSHTAAVKLNVE
jgi:hypothetical protein